MAKHNSNNIKQAAIYLYRCKNMGVTSIAKKLGVNHKTVSLWIQQRVEIENKNKTDLEELLYRFVLEREINWFGD